jgi:hypothetical protein
VAMRSDVRFVTAFVKGLVSTRWEGKEGAVVRSLHFRVDAPVPSLAVDCGCGWQLNLMYRLNSPSLPVTGKDGESEPDFRPKAFQKSMLKSPLAAKW